jgi:hypothetical protein
MEKLERGACMYRSRGATPRAIPRSPPIRLRVWPPNVSGCFLSWIVRRKTTCMWSPRSLKTLVGLSGIFAARRHRTLAEIYWNWGQGWLKGCKRGICKAWHRGPSRSRPKLRFSPREPEARNGEGGEGAPQRCL